MKNPLLHKIIVLLFIITFIFVISVLFKELTKKYFFNGQAYLEVVTKTSGSWIYSGKEKFYYIIDNGKKIETQDFTKKDILQYNISMYNNDNCDYKIANDKHKQDIDSIILLISDHKSLERPFINNVFVVDNYYFIDVYDEVKKDIGYVDILFEYSSNKKELKELCRFYGEAVKHVQLSNN